MSTFHFRDFKLAKFAPHSFFVGISKIEFLQKITTQMYVISEEAEQNRPYIHSAFI